ncbi:stage III sporulation protein SpoIIIAB [Alteribacillus iranensis]|uniref:Stage III sporulation protein AB n=1 Tax=Alteribacillus iranensis TaxID=930128 RepID=A0A1I1ZGY1_9BACI|nr:stage III sporulation protein SpoIIIAB [Alteribacillus iranensis]SFE30905.1 stage III sporulation protein AB [Alteribacillus iranensis]
MSWFGAIFILTACTWTGFEVAKKLTERPRQLRQLKVALQSFEAEIMYGMSPLAEVSEKISKQLPDPVAHLFRYFSSQLKKGECEASEAWNQSLDKTWPRTAMGPQEKEVLKQFGMTMGKHEKMQQQKHIRLALVHLEKEEQEAKEKKMKYEKIAKTMGFLTGLLLIIILI